METGLFLLTSHNHENTFFFLAPHKFNINYYKIASGVGFAKCFLKHSNSTREVVLQEKSSSAKLALRL